MNYSKRSIINLKVLVKKLHEDDVVPKYAYRQEKNIEK